MPLKRLESPVALFDAKIGPKVVELGVPRLSQRIAMHLDALQLLKLQLLEKLVVEVGAVERLEFSVEQ